MISGTSLPAAWTLGDGSRAPSVTITTRPAPETPRFHTHGKRWSVPSP
jgi:hypothetical protein